MDKKLKVGITCYPTYGGSGVIATEIGQAMARRGHRVHFICADVPHRLARFSENVFFHEVEMHDYPLFSTQHYDLALASKMVEVVKHEGLDLLHVHYAVPHATSAYLARQVLGETKLKIITTLHGTDITLVGQERSYLPITRFSIMQSDCVTAPSQFLRGATYDKLNVPSEVKIEVIPNFVDTVAFSPAEQDEQLKMKERLGFTARRPVLVHVSNFRPVKRIEDVVRVFSIVRAQRPCHLLLVGDGPERSKAEDMVRELGLEPDVCFLGKHDMLPEVLRASTVFLMPSKNESFGLAALEAMSCGVPVVGSRAEGIPEVVRHGETGYLAAVGDVEEMARSVLKLIGDDALYAKMSKAARELACREYAQAAVIDRYEELYARVAEVKG